MALITIAFCSMILVVLLHYESLSATTRLLLAGKPYRWRISAVVIILAATHFIEVLIFAVSLYLAGEIWGYGSLVSADLSNRSKAASFDSYVYFSLTSYTSLGIGDIFPLGMLRILTGIESLLGLLMIGWSASFLYLEMRALWQSNHEMTSDA